MPMILVVVIWYWVYDIWTIPYQLSFFLISLLITRSSLFYLHWGFVRVIGPPPPPPPILRFTRLPPLRPPSLPKRIRKNQCFSFCIKRKTLVFWRDNSSTDAPVQYHIISSAYTVHTYFLPDFNTAARGSLQNSANKTGCIGPNTGLCDMLQVTGKFYLVYSIENV